MGKVRVGINGFGSIGRRAFRIAMQRPNVEIVHVNDVTDAKTLAHLLKYDSNYGVLAADVTAEDATIRVNGHPVRVTAESDPASIPWDESGVDIVIESTGRFTDAQRARAHLEHGAKRVILSAPGKNEDITLVLGVNQEAYDSSLHRVISMGSCTTNCIAPVAKVILDDYGIEQGFMTTVHSYTNDQRLLDLPHKDLRRARAAALNMVPTTTGAAKALHLVIPEVKGKLNGLSIRVPTPVVSIIDLVVETRLPVTAKNVNESFRNAASVEMAGILQYTEDPVVSQDLKGNPHSAIVDGLLTQTMGDHLLKVLAWYDNEWAYATRLVDLVEFLAEREA